MATQAVYFVDPISGGRVVPAVAARYASRRAPVAIRNNNMGAISLGRSGWATSLPGYIGKTLRPKAEGGYYAKFATPEHGVAAASRLLERYNSQGINTANAIVRKWSTDRNAWGNYAAMVSQYTGLPADAALDLTDPNVRSQVLMAMSAHESGVGVPVYPPEVFQAGATYQVPDLPADTLGQSDIRRLQEFLAKEGYEPGEIDGIWGPQTQAAIERYKTAALGTGTAGRGEPPADLAGAVIPASLTTAAAASRGLPSALDVSNILQAKAVTDVDVPPLAFAPIDDGTATTPPREAPSPSDQFENVVGWMPQFPQPYEMPDSVSGGSGGDLIAGNAGGIPPNPTPRPELVRGGSGGDLIAGNADDLPPTPQLRPEYVRGGSGGDLIAGNADTLPSSLLSGGSGSDLIAGNADRLPSTPNPPANPRRPAPTSYTPFTAVEEEPAPFESMVATRPETPAGSLPAARAETTVVSPPERPIGSLPAARAETTVAGRPEYPGALPKAPRSGDLSAGMGLKPFASIEDMPNPRPNPSRGANFPLTYTPTPNYVRPEGLTVGGRASSAPPGYKPGSGANYPLTYDPAAFMGDVLPSQPTDIRPDAQKNTLTGFDALPPGFSLEPAGDRLLKPATDDSTLSYFDPVDDPLSIWADKLAPFARTDMEAAPIEISAPATVAPPAMATPPAVAQPAVQAPAASAPASSPFKVGGGFMGLAKALLGGGGFGMGPDAFTASGPSGVSPNGYAYQTGGNRIGSGGQYTTPGGKTITYVQDDHFNQPGYLTGYS